MREYASITLNVTEYACIYPKKQSDEHAMILNVSNEVHSIRSLYKLLKNYRECSCATRHFSGQKGRGLWTQGFLIKISSKKLEKEDPQGNILKFFLLDTLKTRYSQPFFQKSEHFFRFSKAAGDVSNLAPSCSSLSVGEYESAFLDISKYP